MKKTIILLSLTLLCTGCASKTVNIDKSNDQGHAVLSLDYRDFDYAIEEMVQSLLSSGKLKKSDGNQYIVTTAQILNDTTQRIDTRQLMSLVEEKMMNSGQVNVTSAIGDATDNMLIESRTLRNSDEFNQETVMGKGEMIAPELSFSGKIFQRIISYDKKTRQVEYYIQLIVTDLKTGLRFWQKQVQILKRGSTKAAIW